VLDQHRIFLIFKKRLKKLNLDVEVEQVSDTNEIMNYGVMATPGMVINGKAVSSGRMLSVEDAIALIQRHQG